MRLDRWNSRRVCGVACAVTGVVCLAAVSGIRTFSHATDIVCVLAAVAAYVVATAFAWRIWPHAAAVAAGVLAAPLLALAVDVGRFGMAAAFLGLGFVVLDRTAPPDYIEDVSPTLSCRVYDSGMNSELGYTVYLYRHPPFVPLIQLEVAQLTVDARHPRDASCASVAAQLRS